MQEAKFLILEQAFLEALQAGQPAAALTCLREQLAPLGVNPARLHRLAACLMGGGSIVADVLAFPGNGSSSSSSEEEEEQQQQRLRHRGGDALDTVAQRHRVLRKLQVGGQEEGWPFASRTCKDLARVFSLCCGACAVQGAAYRCCKMAVRI